MVQRCLQPHPFLPHGKILQHVSLIGLQLDFWEFRITLRLSRNILVGHELSEETLHPKKRSI